MILITIMMIMIRKLIITMMMIMKVMMATSWNHSAAIIRPPLNTTDPSLSVNLHFKNVVEQMYKWDLQRALYYILLHYTTYSRLWNILNFEISQISMIISNHPTSFSANLHFKNVVVYMEFAKNWQQNYSIIKKCKHTMSWWASFARF